MPSCLRDRLGRAAVVAGHHHRLDPERAAARRWRGPRSGGPCRPPRRRPAARPSTATSISVLPSPSSRSASSARPSSATPCSSSSRRVPTSTLAAADLRRDAAPGQVLEVARPAGRWPARAAPARPGPPAPAGGRCAPRPRRPAAAARPRRRRPPATTSVTRGLPSVSVPVLSKMIAWIFDACSSETACLNRMPRLAARSVATITAVGVASPSASGQAITTAVTAKVSASSSGSRSDEEPDQEGQHARADRDQHQVVRRPVGQPLGRRLAVLGRLDQPDDLRQRRVRADLGGPEAQRARLVDRAGDHLVAGLLLDRDALAGDHALVDRAAAVEHRRRPPAPCRPA